MKNAGKDQVALQATHSRHVSLGGDNPNSAPALYRVPDQPSMDGNTVDSQKESAAVAETAVRYQSTLTFLNARIRGLRLAITGGR